MQNNNQVNNVDTNNAMDNKTEIQSPTPQEILSNEPIANTIPSEVAELNLENNSEAVAPPATAPQVTPSQPIVSQTDVLQPSISQPINPQVENLQAVAPQPIVSQSNEEPANAASEINLNLNLDPNLISNNQLNQMPVVDDLKTSDQASIENTNVYAEKPVTNNIKITDEIEPKPMNSVPAPVEPTLTESTPTEPAPTPEPEPILEQNPALDTNQDQNNFTEEITPLQSKLEQPIIEKPVQSQT